MMLQPLLQWQQHLLVLAIERCALPLPTKKILLEVLSTSVETALKQQYLGTTTVVLWCQIDLDRWAATLELEPAPLLHVLRSVVQEGILLPEQGLYLADGISVTWNLAFDTWPSLLPPPSTGHTGGLRAAVEEADHATEDTEQAPWPHELLAKRWKGRPPRPVWWALRQKVLERDDYTCSYCGRRGGRLTLDHVVPVSRGGTSELRNLVTACVSCNSQRHQDAPGVAGGLAPAGREGMMALPVTTNRAAHAAAHPLHVVKPEAGLSERLPARSSALPFSCSTNLANDVTDSLRQAKLTARAWEVCAYLQRQTFGNAGWHRKRGQPETQCAFDLAAWAAAIPCDRSNLRRTLAVLVACQIIWLNLDPARPGSGQIGWNLAFAHCPPYDQRRQRACRKQAGVVTLPSIQQEASMVKSMHSTSDHAPLPEIRSELTTLACSEGRGQAADAEYSMCLAQQAGMVRSSQGGEETEERTGVFDHARLVKKESYLTTLAWSEVAAEERSSGQRRKGLRKKGTETPDVVSAANASPRESVEQGRTSPAATAPRTGVAAEPQPDAPGAPEPVPSVLQVPAEQLALWREDVAEQRQVVAQAQVAAARASEALEQCAPSAPGWGELRRQQRYFQHQLEAASGKLAQFAQFVTLIEQGATKDEACAAVLGQAASVVEQEAPAGGPAEAAQVEPPPAPAPRLEGQALRRALFATLVRLFTSGDPRHVELEQGKFNKAIKTFVLAGLQPDDLPAVQAAFERLWPRATCTALALANNLPRLLGTAEGMGWQFQTGEAAG